jgi:protein tyrosine/serine phosphatase
MKVKMTLISKGVNIEKVCTTEIEIYTFERDMPAKHNLLFSNKPYLIKKVNLEA